MKRRTKWLMAFGIMVLLAGIIAWRWEPIVRAYIFHRARMVTTALPQCDRVDVFHLNWNQDPDAGFPGPRFRSAGILGTHTLSNTDAEAIAALWRSRTFGPGYQMLCHSPSYGFRFYTGDKLVFETTLCFHCANFHLTSGYWGFDAESPRAGELLRRLQEIFPKSKPKPQ